METSLATTNPPLAPLGGARFANPMAQVRGLFAQPAVRRAMPLILVVLLITAAALAWTTLRTPPQRVLFTSLTDADKGAVAEALTTAGIANDFDQSGALTVAEDSYHKARMLLASQDLPKAAPGGYAILDQLPMGVSRAVEGERLRQARETELARSIQEIDSVAEARVHLATPESSVFVRDKSAPTASVILRLQPGRTLSDAQVRAIVNLTAASVPGMKPDGVTIVDQMGALLSQGDETATAGDARIDFQRKVEEKYRQQLVKLLTPMLGVGNFSAEIQAEVDLDELQATRETYDKTGGVIRAEQGTWTGTDKDGPAPGGIPGALSNTLPATATLAVPTPTPVPTGTPTPGATGVPAPVVAGAGVPKSSEEFARTYDLGKEISVSRAMPGGIKRLSVAVLLREPDDGKPRSKVELQQIDSLVRATVGFNAARADTVTVVSRKFSSDVTDAKPAAWYDAAWVPMVARNATALIIALLVLLIGVRPLVRGLMKKRGDGADLPAGRPMLPGDERTASTAASEGAPGAPPVSIDMIESARGYDNRVGLVRGFTRDNPARAALAVRDMIQADAKS